jgi:hypothetical protein
VKSQIFRRLTGSRFLVALGGDFLLESASIFDDFMGFYGIFGLAVRLGGD